MATTINGSTSRNSSYWKYYLVCTEQNVDVSNNMSKLKVEVYLGATSYSRAVRGNMSATHTVTVNGTNYTFTTGAYTIEKNATIKLGEITSNAISHNTDGTKTVSVSCSSPDLAQASGYGPYSGSANGNVTLSTIPRASSFTTNGSTIGSAVNVSISRASTNFTHTVTLKFGNITETKTGVGTSTSFTPNLNNYGSKIPNSMSGIGTITVDTYNGSTKIGSSTKNITLNLPSDTKPSVPTITLAEAVSGLASKFGAYIQNKSKIKVVASASGVYGSSISSYKIEINGSVYNSSSCTTNALYTAGTNTCKVTVTDSRGKTNTASTTFTVLAYQEPKISKFTAERNHSTPTTVNCVMSASITSLNNKNDHLIKLDLNSTNKYSNTSAYSISDVTQNITGIEQTKSYTVTLTVKDYFTTVTRTINISTDFALMNFSSDGKHIAIGQIYDTSKDYRMQINGQSYLSRSSGDAGYWAERTDTGVKVGLEVGAGGINHGVWSTKLNKWLIYADESNCYLNGNAESSSRVRSRGIISPESGTTKTALEGISMQESYNNSYPKNFGNVLNLKGKNATGCSQLFLGWEGSDLIGGIYYRSLRDMTSSWSNWGRIYTETVLYSNSSGTSGTVTLNESANNFTYLEIFSINSDDVALEYQSVKVFFPGEKKFIVNTVQNGTNKMYMTAKRYKILGTSITVDNAQQVAEFTNAATAITNYDNTKIRLVLGYR